MNEPVKPGQLEIELRRNRATVGVAADAVGLVILGIVANAFCSFMFRLEVQSMMLATRQAADVDVRQLFEK